MSEIKPDGTNWKQFCAEPTLTDEEHAEWSEMCAEIVKNDAVFTFVEDRTETEWAGACRAKPGPDWSDMIEWADANHRLQRAEIKAWQEWKKEKEGES